MSALSIEGSPVVAGAATVAPEFAGFDDFYRHEHPRVLATLMVVSGDAELAREATDEAFARALARWARVRTMESPGGWLYTVALNLVRRTATRRAAERRAQAKVDSPAVVRDHDRDVWEVVQALPPRQRAAVVLRYLIDMKEREIADVMHIAPGTVAATLAAARKTLGCWLTDPPEAQP